MAKVITFEHDGKLKIIIPAPKYMESLDPALSEDEKLDLVEARSMPAGVPANKKRRVQNNQISSDRTFRNAWEFGPSKVDVNMPKARVIHQAKIDRIHERESDIIIKQIIKKQAKGEDVTVEQTELNGLDTARANVGPNINAAGTPAILKAVWPAGLPTE